MPARWRWFGTVLVIGISVGLGCREKGGERAGHRTARICVGDAASSTDEICVVLRSELTEQELNAYLFERDAAVRRVLSEGLKRHAATPGRALPDTFSTALGKVLGPQVHLEAIELAGDALLMTKEPDPELLEKLKKIPGALAYDQ